MSLLFQNDSKTIGILGGGQLATMMIEAAHRMGCNVAVLDPNPSCSASHVLSAKTDTLVVGNFNDEADVVNFVEKWCVFMALKLAMSVANFQYLLPTFCSIWLGHCPSFHLLHICS